MLNRVAIYPRPAVPLRCARSAPDFWRSTVASDAEARVVCLIGGVRKSADGRRAGACVAGDAWPFMRHMQGA
jgi:hypothetical protein